MAAEDVFKVGDATIDLNRGTLSVSGDLVPIRSKTFNLLSHLVRNPGRVITKDEIFEVVWPGVIVTEDSLTRCVRDARKAIRDDMQEILRTVPRRGYILVEQGAPARTDGGEGIAQHDAAERLAEPVVAILPFVVDAVDGEGRIPLQSFNEELIDAISRFRSVAVIAPASVRRFAFDDDIARAGVALKADYCVSGSIANGKEIAVRVDLVEVSSAVVYGPIPSLPPSHISWRPQRCWQPESSDVWSGRSKPMRRAGRRGRPPRACKPMPT